MARPQPPTCEPPMNAMQKSWVAATRGGDLREDVSPTQDLEWEALTTEVRELLRELRPIEADILRQRFGLEPESGTGEGQELTLKEIGDKYNLSRERIRQLQEQALAKMRRALARRDLL